MLVHCLKQCITDIKFTAEVHNTSRGSFYENNKNKLI